MATYRFELNTKADRNKKYNILLCITIAGKRKRIKTDISLDRKTDFNPKCKGNNWIKPREPNYKAWNEALADIIESARAKYKELKEGDAGATADNLARAVRGEDYSPAFLTIKGDELSGFAADAVNEIHNEGSIRNWKKYNGFLNKLADFMKKALHGKTELVFAELTPRLVEQFKAYLQTLHNTRCKEQRMLHTNTIANILHQFRCLVKKGIEKGLLASGKNPFLDYKIKETNTEKEKLTIGEIKALEGLKLAPGSLGWHCRNAFMFSFYCAGIRAGDLLLLRWINVTGGRLNYQMSKNHKIRDLKLVPQAIAILEQYRTDASKPTDFIFPFMDKAKPYASATTQAERDTLPSEMKQRMFEEISSKNSLINKYLKKLAVMAGIGKKVTMHISRHSFASIAAQEGIDTKEVQSMLGHSKLQTTEGYMGNFSSDKIDAALEGLFASSAKKQLLSIIKEMTEQQAADLLATLNK